MIQMLQPGEDSLKQVAFEDSESFRAQLHSALWIDLMSPEPAEEEFIEATLGLNLPSLEEMNEISESSRLFEDEGALYMSCWVLCFDAPIPINTSVTLVFTDKHFVSIRYSDHHAFRIFNHASNRLKKRAFSTTAGPLVDLLDAITGNIASNLRMVERSLNGLSIEIFAEQKEQKRAQKNGGLKNVVQRLGKRSSLVACLREGSTSLAAVIPFLIENGRESIRKELALRLQTIGQDIKSLRQYDSELSSEINFLLDSTVGLINIEQNQSIKVLSVAAVLVAFI
jgi:magnesium transporter